MSDKSSLGMALTLLDIPLFAGLKDKELRTVAGAFREATYNQGTAILHEGDESPDFFILVKGKVQISRAGQILATLAPYEFFGELTSLGFQRYATAEVMAQEPCTCIVSGRDKFERMLESNPPVAKRFLKNMRDRYQNENPEGRALDKALEAINKD